MASASDFANMTGASSTGSTAGGGGDEECIVAAAVVDFVVVDFVVASDAFSFAPAEACCGSSCCCAAMGCRGPFILAPCVGGEARFRDKKEKETSERAWSLENAGREETCRKLILKKRMSFFSTSSSLFFFVSPLFFSLPLSLSFAHAPDSVPDPVLFSDLSSSRL